MTKYEYSIAKETFCYYCQKEFKSAAKLKSHVRHSHPGTYAELALDEAEPHARE